MIKRATLTLEFVTPCFLAGADQGAPPQWRAASVRGQLRWWYRAVAGAAHGGDLGRVRQLEESVFGSTRRGSPVRVAALGAPDYHTVSEQPFQERRSAEQLAELWGLQPHHPDYRATVDRLTVRNPKKPEQIITTDPLQYLGYGCVDIYNLSRPCIAARQKAALQLQWRTDGPTPDAAAWTLLRRALWAWLHLGGIGSKARNGYGSLRCTAVDGELGPDGTDFPCPQTRSNFETELRSLLETVRKTGPSRDEARWTQLGPDTTVHLGAEMQDSWEKALTLVGAWLIAYRRRYGAPLDSRSRDGRPLKDRDYSWAAPNGDRTHAGIPDKAGFGLPLPFGKHEIVTWWGSDDRNKEQAEPSDHRRSSPLHVHIAHLDGGYLPVLTHIPSQFLPADGELAYVKHPVPSRRPDSAQLGIVEAFLADLQGKNLIREISP